MLLLRTWGTTTGRGKGYRSTDAGIMATTKERRGRSKRARRADYNSEKESQCVWGWFGGSLQGNGLRLRYGERDLLVRASQQLECRLSTVCNQLRFGKRTSHTHRLSITSPDRPIRGRHDPGVAQSCRRPAQASLMLVVLRARYLRAAM